MSLQIVLAHGLHASPTQLGPLAAHLKALGHRVACVDFATRRGLVSSVAEATHQLDHLFPTGEVNVVGFSFGALVGRALAHTLVAQQRCPALVQIAPPNRGAEWARRVRVGAVLSGVGDLVPGSRALQTLPIPDCAIGILAGTVKVALTAPITWPAALGNALFKVEDEGDGTVTLAETELPRGEPADRITLPHAHDHLPKIPAMHAQVAHFLEHRRFRH